MKRSRFFASAVVLLVALVKADDSSLPTDLSSSVEPNEEKLDLIKDLGSQFEEKVGDDEADANTLQKEEINASEDTTAPGKRIWGATGSPPSAGMSESNEDSESTQNSGHQQASGASGDKNASRIPFSHIPFVSSKSNVHHDPPEGFVLSARVYIDPADKLAHFDDNPHPVTIPYWDCGTTGATTSPLALRNGYFRHALASTSTSWSGTDGKHPVLVVALSPFLLELNSGASRRFEAGDVVLLEDVLLSGHRMKATKGDLKVLFLTLPQQHYHVGKEHLSLKTGKKTQDPCPDVKPIEGSHQESFQSVRENALLAPTGWTGRRIRLTVLAALGMSLSTLAADFLGKTAPLWLAVGVGGTCFVAGSTYALTVGGDKLLTAIELRQEKRRLETPSRDQDKMEDRPPEVMSM